MRTTIVLDNTLEQKIRDRVNSRKISEFINGCIKKFFDLEEHATLQKKLEKAYRRANKDLGKNQAGDFVEIEDWPEW